MDESKEAQYEAVLSHISRYRLTTTAALDEVIFGGNVQRRKNVIKKLGVKSEKPAVKGTEQLVSHPLTDRNKTVYYQLTEEAGIERGAPVTAYSSINSQNRIVFLGCLAFCCLGPIKRERLTPEELAGHEIGSHLGNTAQQQVDYYLDHDGNTVRLGRILVDFSTDAAKLLGKARKIAETLSEKKELRPLITDKLFVISIVVAEEEKRQSLIDQLRKKPLPVWTRVEAYPLMRGVKGPRKITNPDKGDITEVPAE